MVSDKTVLYGKGNGGIKKWIIWSEGSVILIEANSQRYSEMVPQGLAGRTLADQVELRIQARIRVKLDTGFKRTIEELRSEVTNQLGEYAPMLAQPYKGQTIKDGFVQPKLDGHRCLINNNGAYSRRGKTIETIPEIVDAIGNLSSDVTVDGELYSHGVPLQKIASWAKRRQPNTLKLVYHVYDVIIRGITYEDRRGVMEDMDWSSSFLKLVPHEPLVMVPMEYCVKYRRAGYEGAILRRGSGMYEIGKRSANLLKVKMRNDAEFQCIDVEKGKDDSGILVLKTLSGKVFRTLAPGPMPTKRRTFIKKEEYIGRYVTCAYADLTNDGIPFHCIALRWHISL